MLCYIPQLSDELGLVWYAQIPSAEPEDNIGKCCEKADDAFAMSGWK